MKKILLLLLILIFGFQASSAQDESIDDINSYFNEDTSQEELHGYVEYIQPEQVETEQESVYLEDVHVKSINISQPKNIESKSLITSVKKPTFQPIQEKLNAASHFSSQEYNVAPVSTTLGKKFGKMSFGTMYDSSLDSSAQHYYSTGLFAKYEGKHYALSTGFSKNTNYNFDSYNDKVYFAPELKLTKRLSLLDIMQTDVNQINKKNEVVLRYTPNLKNHADDVQFELGAGQTFFEDAYVKSQVRFSTRFKL